MAASVSDIRSSKSGCLQEYQGILGDVAPLASGHVKPPSGCAHPDDHARLRGQSPTEGVAEGGLRKRADLAPRLAPLDRLPSSEYCMRIRRAATLLLS